jgi:hypothetical protein
MVVVRVEMVVEVADTSGRDGGGPGGSGEEVVVVVGLEYLLPYLPIYVNVS